MKWGCTLIFLLCAPKKQGRGIGEKLMSAVLDAADRYGLRVLRWKRTTAVICLFTGISAFAFCILLSSEKPGDPVLHGTHSGIKGPAAVFLKQNGRQRTPCLPFWLLKAFFRRALLRKLSRPHTPAARERACAALCRFFAAALPFAAFALAAIFIAAPAGGGITIQFRCCR